MGGMAAGSELKCLRLAATQHGLLRRDQAFALGLSPGALRWRLRRGRWTAVRPGVYRIEGAPLSWRQELKAVCLWAARGAAVSHRAAAALWGLARFRPGPVELSVTRDLRLAGPAAIHRVDSLGVRDVQAFDGLPVTSPTRTLLDLCATEDRATLEATLDECLRRKLTSLEKLSAALDRAPGHRGTGFLRALLVRYQGGEAPAESEAEAKLLEVIDDAGLPRPEKQREVSARGRLRRLDFAYRVQRLALEVDGYAYHSDPTAFEKDRERRNALTSRGWKVLNFTWRALNERPDEVAEDIRRALGAARSSAA
jgi:very-short-patch-repair endonuclease